MEIQRSNADNTKKKGRRKRIFLCALAIAGISVIGIGIWQKNNISAMTHFVKYTQEELEEQIQENDRIIKDAVNVAPEIAVRPVTDEERAALRDGSLTYEDLVGQLITSESTNEESKSEPDPSGDVIMTDTKNHEIPDSPQPQPTTEQKKDSNSPTVQPPAGKENQNGSQITTPSKPGETGSRDELQERPTSGTLTPDQAQLLKPAGNSECDQKISEIIAGVYVLREKYLLELDELEKAAKADYHAIPEENRSTKRIAELMSSYLSKATALEKECDGEMDKVCSNLKKLLKENGRDLSLVDTVAYTYANEKSLKKAWYMNELQKKGLM